MIILITLFVVIMTISALSLADNGEIPVGTEKIFQDEFPGSVLDVIKWDTYNRNSLQPSVGNGSLTINTIPDGICAISTKTDLLDFSDKPDRWSVSMRFIVNGIETRRPDRQVILLMPCSGWGVPPDTWEAIAFDLRLRKIKGEIWLTWRGYDGTGNGREGVRLTELEQGRYYTVTVMVKSNEQKVDIYLDDKLIAAKNMLIGSAAGNIGQKYPDTIVIGTVTDPNINMSIDFISVGIVKNKIEHRI